MFRRFQNPSGSDFSNVSFNISQMIIEKEKHLLLCAMDFDVRCTDLIRITQQHNTHIHIFVPYLSFNEEK